jgi:hypothetical protein
MILLATVRWSSVELVRLPRLLSVMDARPPFERRGAVRE